MNRARYRLPALLFCCFSLGGCYVMQAASGQMDVMAKRQPISKVVADPATPPKLKSQLEMVLEIREFATRELSLPDDGSYRSYADVNRPFVVWNVFAAGEFSVDPKRWCFPIAGCVVYRGYFSEEKAQNFASRLAGDGYDVHVGGVPAYSTLGHFDDPVLNTMMAWNNVEIAAIIFHELAHHVVYVPGDSSFNEAFASVVEDEGVRRWLAAQGRDAELAAFIARRQRSAEVTSLLTSTRRRLRTLYASGLEADAMREQKRAEFERLKNEYATLRASWPAQVAFDARFAGDLNNAYLVSVATYQECKPGFKQLLAAAADELPAFYSEVKTLAREPEATRHAKICAAPASLSEKPGQE